MRCDIIIPVWNQWSFTKDCVDSISKNTDDNYRIIIVDNASDNKTREYLDSLERSKKSALVIRNEKNLGFVKAVNEGMRHSAATYVCILNNDTIVTKDWLKIMMDIADSRPDIGIVNPSSNNLGQRPSEGEPIEHYAERLRGQVERFIEIGSAIGFCMLIKRTVIEKIGMFDEIYGMGNFEDTDFSRRAIKEGYRCVRACGAYVYHRERSSFNRLKTYEDDFDRNKEIYEFRWGRPRRIAYILDSYDTNVLKRLNMETLRLARNGNWVWYFSKDRIEVPEHSNIIYADMAPNNFYIKALFTILKKKKKFDEILVSTESLGKILERLSFIHKAKVSYF